MYDHNEAPHSKLNSPRSAANGTAIAPSDQRSTAEIIDEALPDLIAYDIAQQRRLQQALIDCRTGGPDAPQEQKLRAAFWLYDEEMLTRGDICALFDLDVWQFMDYSASFAPNHE